MRNVVIATAVVALLTMIVIVWLVMCLAGMANTKPGLKEWALLWVPAVVTVLAWIGVIVLWIVAIRRR